MVLAVRDHIPLKQGLRRANDDYQQKAEVRDHIPLKQGLRLHKAPRDYDGFCPRPYSIKTRIKTAPR